MAKIVKADFATMLAGKPVIVGRSAELAEELPLAPQQEGDDHKESDMLEQIRLEAEGEYRRAYGELLDAAREEAAAIMEEAREEAQKESDAARRRAEAEAEGIRQRAIEEGYAQGIEEGAIEVGELLEKGQQDIDALMEEGRLENERLLDGAEPALISLSVDMAKKILGYELDRNEQAYLSMVRAALGEIKSENKVTLRVNPGEYVRFFKQREVTMYTSNGSVEATVISDASIGYSGCLVETDSGIVDAGADAQMAQIANSLGVDGE